jgi:DNA-binding transcriptional LysR family regulator
LSEASILSARLVIDRYLQQAGVSESMNVVVELGSPEAIKGLVATGMGFAIMSRVIASKELQLGQLVQIALRPRLLRNFSVVYAKERFHSKLVAAFLHFATEQLSAGGAVAAQQGADDDEGAGEQREHHESEARAAEKRHRRLG